VTKTKIADALMMISGKRTYHGFRNMNKVPIVSFTYGENSAEILTPEKSWEINKYSPDGFEWGYSGSGPRQLALALLLEHYNKKIAKKLSLEFLKNVVSFFDEENWLMSEEDICAFVDSDKNDKFFDA
tara:strand:+ start:685 stop:1068 length:384 start_codon:yes stop_codon:yes gene_type:complete